MAGKVDWQSSRLTNVQGSDWGCCGQCFTLTGILIPVIICACLHRTCVHFIVSQIWYCCYCTPGFVNWSGWVSLTVYTVYFIALEIAVSRLWLIPCQLYFMWRQSSPTWCGQIWCWKCNECVRFTPEWWVNRYELIENACAWKCVEERRNRNRNVIYPMANF